MLLFVDCFIVCVLIVDYCSSFGVLCFAFGAWCLLMVGACSSLVVGCWLVVAV